jgi:hypothetical protein
LIDFFDCCDETPGTNDEQQINLHLEMAMRTNHPSRKGSREGVKGETSQDETLTNFSHGDARGNF